VHRGTPYALVWALSYVCDLSIDEIKLDRHFIASITVDHGERGISIG
jgi:hypothetical protein